MKNLIIIIAILSINVQAAEVPEKKPTATASARITLTIVKPTTLKEKLKSACEKAGGKWIKVKENTFNCIAE